MILYAKQSGMTINLSSGGILEVEDYKLDCSDEQAARLLTEMPISFSRTPFPSTAVEPVIQPVVEKIISKPILKARSKR